MVRRTGRDRPSDAEILRLRWSVGHGRQVRQVRAATNADNTLGRNIVSGDRGRLRRWMGSLRLRLRSPYYSDHADWRKRFTVERQGGYWKLLCGGGTVSSHSTMQDAIKAGKRHAWDVCGSVTWTNIDGTVGIADYSHFRTPITPTMSSEEP